MTEGSVLEDILVFLLKKDKTNKHLVPLVNNYIFFNFVFKTKIQKSATKLAGYFKKLTSLKNSNNQTKVMLSIGGPDFADEVSVSETTLDCNCILKLGHFTRKLIIIFNCKYSSFLENSASKLLTEIDCRYSVDWLATNPVEIISSIIPFIIFKKTTLMDW